MANINLKRVTMLQGKVYAIGTHKVSDEVAADPYLELLAKDGHAEIFDGSEPKELVETGEGQGDAKTRTKEPKVKEPTYNEMLSEAKDFGLFTDGKRPNKAELIAALEQARADAEIA